MNKAFTDIAWEQYLSWQNQDKKILKKINSLIKDIERNGVLDGIGRPERLIGDLNHLYSRHITDEHRLVYYIEGENIIIVACKSHYESI